MAAVGLKAEAVVVGMATVVVAAVIPAMEKGVALVAID